MFFFTYVPQMAIMAFTSGPLAAISAALLVLSESSAITNVLSRSFLVEDALIDTFDGTLVARDQEPLVAQGREIKSRSSGRDAMSRLGKIFTRPLARLHPRALLRALIVLPPEPHPRGRHRVVYLRARKTSRPSIPRKILSTQRVELDTAGGMDC